MSESTSTVHEKETVSPTVAFVYSVKVRLTLVAPVIRSSTVTEFAVAGTAWTSISNVRFIFSPTFSETGYGFK